MKCKVGDWVRFYQNEKMVIGVVQYVRTGKCYEAEQIIDTDVGGTDSSEVMEVRHAD